MTIPLKAGMLYGPVNSRRLGKSLGINLLPPDRKACTFDCLYCQYGWTPRNGAAQEFFPDPEAVRKALEEFFPTLSEPPAYLTFSGNGEPTLHPRFPEIVEAVIGIRDRLAPSTRTAVLSNSTTVHIARVRDALRRLDVRIMKLDAGTEAEFGEYNRPVNGLFLKDIIEGLMDLGQVTIQALWTGGPSGNFSQGEVEAWVARLKRIRPVAVQIYTLARGWPEPGLQPLERECLEDIRARLEAEGIPARAY